MMKLKSKKGKKTFLRLLFCCLVQELVEPKKVKSYSCCFKNRLSWFELNSTTRLAWKRKRQCLPALRSGWFFFLPFGLDRRCDRYADDEEKKMGDPHPQKDPATAQNFRSRPCAERIDATQTHYFSFSCIFDPVISFSAISTYVLVHTRRMTSATLRTSIMYVYIIPTYVRTYPIKCSTRTNTYVGRPHYSTYIRVGSLSTYEYIRTYSRKE